MTTGPEKLTGEELQDTKDFIRYVLILFGFLFVLLFQRSISFHLDKPMWGPWTMGFCWVGVAVFFGVHAYCLARMLLLYTRYELSRKKQYSWFLFETKGSVAAVLASHFFCIVLPCGVLWHIKHWRDASLLKDPNVSYSGYIVLDIALIVVMALLAWYYKRRGLGDGLEFEWEDE